MLFKLLIITVTAVFYLLYIVDVSKANEATNTYSQKETDLNKLFGLIQESKGHKNWLVNFESAKDLLLKKKHEKEGFIGDNEENKHRAENKLNADDRKYVPSLMAERLKEQREYQRNNSANTSTNIVETVPNTGPVIISCGGFVIVELRFEVERILLEEIVTDAAVFVSSHAKNTFWRFPSSGIFLLRFSLYSLMKHKIPRLRQFVNEYVKTALHYPSSEINTSALFTQISSLGTPLATETVLHAGNRFISRQSRGLEIISFFDKFRNDQLRQRLRTNQLILVLEEDERGSFFFPRIKNSKVCLKLPEIRLAVTYRNKLKQIHGKVRSAESSDTLVFSHPKRKPTTAEREKFTAKLTEVFGSIHSRNSRSVKSNICQRHSMWVNFSDLGWSDWIIAPRMFQAYMCTGTCPYTPSGKFNSTNHAMLMTMMNSIDPQNSQPCCVPTSLSYVSILYLDKSDNVVLRKYEGMIVESCGCQ